jgi:Fe2+ transport system protein B
MRLSDSQFESLEKRVEEVELDNYQLKLDLLDHIACSIEELMHEGQEFEDAAEDVFKTFTARYIRRIEHTTERLIEENMKKRTAMLGIIGVGLTTVGASMKVLHLMGASVIFGLGILTLVFGFFGSNALDTIRNMDSLKGRAVQIIGALGAMATLVGGFLKIMHLPGAQPLLTAGPVILILYFSFSAFLRTKVPE